MKSVATEKDVVYVRSQDTAYFPVFISPVAAGHVGVSISASNEVTKQEEKQTQYKCLSSSPAHIHSQEEKGTLLHLCAAAAEKVGMCTD